MENLDDPQMAQKMLQVALLKSRVNKFGQKFQKCSKITPNHSFSAWRWSKSFHRILLEMLKIEGVKEPK